MTNSKSRRLIATIAFVAFLAISKAVAAVDGVSVAPRTTGTFANNYKMMVEGGGDEDVTLPIPFYVIRHPQGIVLFDSGLGLEYRHQVAGWWVSRLIERFFPASFREDDAAVRQLEREGIRPDDVKFIVISHLHYDHAGGLRDFPRATVVVSRKEWENANVGRWKARSRGVMIEQLEGIDDRLQLIDYPSSPAMGPFADSFDLFGDGALILLSTPGHTPGHQSLLVTAESGKKVLLTGDAVWVREGYQRPSPKSFLVRHLEEDEEPAWASTLAIHQFAEMNPDVLVIPGHDPYLWKDLPSEVK